MPAEPDAHFSEGGLVIDGGAALCTGGGVHSAVYLAMADATDPLALDPDMGHGRSGAHSSPSNSLAIRWRPRPRVRTRDAGRTTKPMPWCSPSRTRKWPIRRRRSTLADRAVTFSPM